MAATTSTDTSAMTGVRELIILIAFFKSLLLSKGVCCYKREMILDYGGPKVRLWAKDQAITANANKPNCECHKLRLNDHIFLSRYPAP